MAAMPENVGLAQALSKGMPWLDGVAKVMEKAFTPLLGQEAPREPRDFLYGTWLGHPLHAAAVTVPMGAWAATTLCDLLRQDEAADKLLGVGIVGAAGAALTGAAQWQDATKDIDVRRIGALHAMLNTATTGMMAGSWLMRQNGRRPAGVALSTLGLGLNVAAAWLGGELAYGLGIGVDHTTFQKKPANWTDVAALDDLTDGKPMRVDARGTPVLLLRQGNRLRAIAATCPHLGGPLDKGEIDGTTVVCPWHASVFSLKDGSPIHGPATVPVTAFEARISDGRVEIRANALRAGAALAPDTTIEGAATSA